MGDILTLNSNADGSRVIKINTKDNDVFVSSVNCEYTEITIKPKKDEKQISRIIKALY